MVTCGKRDFLQKRRVKFAVDETLRQARFSGHEGEDLSVGKQGCDALRNTLSAASRYEPMMNNRNPHSASMHRRGWPLI